MSARHFRRMELNRFVCRHQTSPLWVGLYETRGRYHDAFWIRTEHRGRGRKRRLRSHGYY